MLHSGDWQLNFEVDDSSCPLAFCWKLNRRILSIIMSCGDWNAYVGLKNMDYVDAAAVKRGLGEMFQPAEQAKMPEPLRGLQTTIEEKIDEWFVSQPQ